MFLKMKLSEVVIDTKAVPSQNEMQVVKSIFDGSEKQEPVTPPIETQKQEQEKEPATPPIETHATSGKSRLLNTVMVGIIITLLLVLQPWLNKLFLKLNLRGFTSIFIEVIFSLLLFYFLFVKPR